MATINLVTALKLIRYNTDPEVAAIVQATIDELDRLQKLERQIEAGEIVAVSTQEPKVGDKATCQACGFEIVYAGPYWQHNTGAVQPRHPAWPKEEPTAL